MSPETLTGLSRKYPVWLCDVWGVVHDGIHNMPSAVAALEKHRAEGGKVVFITNAPRPKSTIVRQIEHIGITAKAYDDLVSSGDVTTDLMHKLAPGGLYHWGPQTDRMLLEDAGHPRASFEKAAAIVCTGFHDPLNETVEDLMPKLQSARARQMPMICANPDKVVRIGDQLVPCAGTLAEAYDKLGGKVLMAGKPFPPIYELALSKAGNPPRDQVMVIGDGIDTDVAGAAAQNLPCLFVTGGINTHSDPGAAAQEKYPAVRIVASMPELEWR